MIKYIQLVQDATNTYWGDVIQPTVTDRQHLQKQIITSIKDMMPFRLHTVEERAEVTSAFFLWYINTHPLYTVRNIDIEMHMQYFMSSVTNKLYCEYCVKETHAETEAEIIVDELLEELEIGEEEIW